MEYMVFDIGGTFIKHAVMDGNARILNSGKIATPQEGLEVFLSKLSEVVAEQKRRYDIQGIAISSPGAVEADTGYVGGSSAVPYIHGNNIAMMLKERTQLKVTVENDANCAALAEGWLGAARDVDDYVCIVVGTGIGGCIVKDNKILRGSSLHGGEFGYMIIGNPLENPLATTWSQVASTNALVKEVEKRKSLPLGSLDGEKVFRMVEEGDRISEESVRLWYKKLAAGIYNIQYVIDPQKILIGGGISKRLEVIRGINEELALLKDEISTLDIRVEACELGNDANLAGALYHFLYSIY